VAIAEAICWADALRRLELRAAGGNFRTLQKWARRWDISTSHFDPNAARGRSGAFRRTPIEQILVENSSFHRGHLKERLYREGIFARRCAQCGQGESWRGRPMALILDHINGNPTDNRIENLQIVCPNCAATLDTHCGRNLPRTAPRTCEWCEETFSPRYRA
jgi:hypothetical protein